MIDSVPYRILVTGSTSWWDKTRIAIEFAKILWQLPQNVEITLIHGDASGGDTLAAEIAEELGWHIDAHPVTKDDWRKYGKSAGVLRNVEMLDLNPNLVLGLWDGESKTVATCLAEAKKRGYKVYHIIDNRPAPQLDKPKIVQTSLI